MDITIKYIYKKIKNIAILNVNDQKEIHKGSTTVNSGTVNHIMCVMVKTSKVIAHTPLDSVPRRKVEVVRSATRFIVRDAISCSTS